MDPADDYEKQCWDKELIRLNDLPDDVDLVPDDFEDPRWLYASLGIVESQKCPLKLKSRERIKRRGFSSIRTRAEHTPTGTQV